MPRQPKDDPQLGLDPLFARSEATAAPAVEVLSVTELVQRASRTLSRAFGQVWVEGELSGVRRISSGHVFFTLKDARSQVSCVLFRSDAARVRFRLEDGLAVRCHGAVRLYEAQGRFQLYVNRLEPVGLGALMLALEQRKRRLAAEGLFDSARKRPLPPFPRTVGVVTSATGAAFRDILQVAARRFPTRIVLSPAPVQGDEAPPRLVAALETLARLEGVEVIILGRGGGSVEDLFCFNDEALVRAVAACPIPVVSAVGHEIDTTLCDLAADLRAPTPSAAAELVLPDRRAVQRSLRALADRLSAAAAQHLAASRAALQHERSRLPDPRPRLLDARMSLERYPERARAAMDALLARRRAPLETARARLASHHPAARLSLWATELRRLSDRAGHAARQQLAGSRQRLESLDDRLARGAETLLPPARNRLAVAAARLDALSPLRVLGRGYAVVLGPDGAAVTDAASLAAGDPVRVRLHRGQLDATVAAVHPPPEDDA